jgi:hypothetical protein
MQDVTQGTERVRRWPRKRPKKPSKKQRQVQDKFAQANRAFSYQDPQVSQWMMSQVEGTPLLPRDIMTMTMFGRLMQIVAPDGQDLWPMPARNDVSEALDVLGKQEGSTLIRGKDYWQALAASPGGSITPLMAVATVETDHKQPGGVWSPVKFDKVLKDPGNWWRPADYGFRPTLAGWYLLAFRVDTNRNEIIDSGAMVNGSVVRLANFTNYSDDDTQGGVTVAEVNGTTDVLQAGILQNQESNLDDRSERSYMAIIGPF